MKENGLPVKTEIIRQFNRFYTRQIGLLNKGLLESPFSLVEARVIYELANRQKATATDLCNELGLDAGYLSRILQNFQKRSLIVKQTSDSDARQNFISLTTQGQQEFALLNKRSQNEIKDLLEKLPISEQNRLIKSMQVIESILNTHKQKKSYLLRPHQPGDMGWVTHRHGILYSEEYGWDEHFEALVAEIVAHFIRNFDSKRERCWIAEIDGEIVGSVFLVKKTEEVAKLRLLLVEPKARGLGIGARLVEECTRFAKRVGYKKITLWTQSNLHAARGIYKKAGYQLVLEEPHHSFGFDLIGETWELDL